MKAITMNQKEFDKLINYEVSVINTEGRLYILNDNILFKRFYVDEGEYFGNKLLTLNTLMDNKDLLSDKNLVLPNKIILVDKKLVGFSMPFIKDNINLTILLKEKTISLDEKLKYLKDVGTILESVQNVKEFKDNFFLNDVHSGNFVIDLKNSKEIYAVDLDSSKIGDNMPFASKILATNFNIKSNRKYKVSRNGLIMPDKNTEWLCYNIMILNFISNFNVNSLSVGQFDSYLQYLEDLNFNKDLIDCFSKIYSKTNDNLNPKDYIDTIPKDYIKADFENFKRRL